MDSFNIETLSAWHHWLKDLHKEQFVFLGYPLNRYEWKDSKSGDRVAYISPVFIQPFIYEVRGTALQLQAAGSIRINEGWLERRLPNIEERRAFVELCGISEDSDADADLDRFENRDPWAEYARLLQHYYPNWCIEPLNSRQLSASPALEKISRDGIYNRAGLVLSRAWKYTKRLYNELIELGSFMPDEQLDGTALCRLFPNQPTKTAFPNSLNVGNREKSIEVIGAQVPSLNHEQRQACEAAATQALSIVVGPPGTGKSRVVAGTLAQQAIIGSDALFASRNHRALEAVVPRVSALTEPFSLILRLNRPWGDPVDNSLELAIQELVFSPPPRHASILPDLRERLAKRILRYREASDQILAIADVRSELRKSISRLEDAKKDLPKGFVENFSFQKVVPQKSDVVSVIHDLRAKQRLKFSFDWFFDLFNHKQRISNALAKAVELDQELRRAFDKGKSLPQIAIAKPSAEMARFYEQALVFWSPFLIANELAGNTFQSRERLKQLPDLQIAYEQELECSDAVVKLSHETLIELSRMAGGSLTDEERTLLASVNSAIQNQSGLDSDEDKRRLANAMRKTFPIFLDHFPLAATTNLSVGTNLPLQSGLYDLLIIDEASQCDIASVIPLLYRAKRAMIVGDPMQLTHVTTLSAATDRHLRKQFGLTAIEFERFSYRTTSMFNLANTSPVVDSRISLRQHHRCHPAIADYCSETFYKGAWTVLTQHDPLGGLRWTQVDDDCVGAAGGGSVSNNQIVSIVHELERLKDDGFVGSIGVVTPFRQQANRIRDAVGQAIDPLKLKAWRFHVDTADGFQGDERDIILFSLVGGESLKPGSLRFLSNSPNRFNVAASRAQKLLHVFGDMEWASKSGIRHIQILADRCREAEAQRLDGHQAPFRVDLVGPVWEPRLAQALTAASIPFLQQYPTCGRFLDFAAIKPGLKLDIEVDGETYHRDEQGNRLAEDILRDQVLVADGWRILRFWVYQLKEDMPGCIETVRCIWQSPNK